MLLRFVGSMCSIHIVICTVKSKSLTTGHFLSFHSRVAVQQISCTNSYSTEMRTDGYH